jgi:hypothetical protein
VISPRVRFAGTGFPGENTTTMSLHIVLGMPNQKPDADVAVVYAGRSGAAAREAMAKSAFPRHMIFANPMGIPKNNPLAAANAAAKVSVPRSRK